MIWCVRAALALVILAFVPGLMESFEPPKAAVVRACGLGLLAAVLVGRGMRTPARLQPLDVAVVTWIAVETVATGFSASPLLSLVGEPARRDGLLTSLALAGIYLAVRASGPRPDPAAAEVTLRWMVAAALAASGFALLQGLGLDPIAAVGAAPAGGATRPAGTLGHPGLLGAVTAAAIPVALVRAILGGPARGQYLAALAVLGAANLVTFSRGAWFAAGIGALVAVGLAVRVRPEARPWRHVALWAAGALVALATVVWAAGWGGVLLARAREILYPMATGGSGRLELWRAAWDGWLARPLLGHGPDTFDLVFTRYQSADYWRLEWGRAPVHAHSVYLHALATRGLLGLLSLAFLAIASLLAARTAWRLAPEARPVIAALVALLASGAAAGASWTLGIAGALIAIVGAASLANLVGTQHGILPLHAERPRAGRAARIAALAAGGLVAALGLADLAASAATREAVRRLAAAWPATGEDGRRERQRALGPAARAARLSPADDAAHRLHAEALLEAAYGPARRGHVGSAIEASRRAVRLVPDRAANHEQLAWALAEQALESGTAGGEVHGAIERVTQLAPVDPRRLVAMARLELELDHMEHARALARRTAEIHPDDARAALVLAQAAFALGDAAEARAALRRAFSGDWRGDSTAWEAARRLRTRLP